MKNITSLENKIIDYAQLGVLGLLTFLLCIEFIFSLSWRMQHDTPLLHYVAFLIDKHDFTPYKDVFETSMPGTFLFHLAIGKLLGYSDTAFKIVDVIYLSFLLGITWLLMKPLGKAVAFTSPLIFGLIYLGYGPEMSLQRDYVGILPIAMALLLVTKDFAWKRRNLKAFIIGALFAFSSSIKPHLAIGLPVLIIYMSLGISPDEHKGQKGFFRHSLQFGSFSALGFTSILSLSFIWLWSTGGIAYFWDMFSSYLPLHTNLTVSHETISGLARLEYIVKSYRHFGGLGALLIPTALGMYIVFSELENKSKTKFIVLLTTLLVLYSIYPVLSGQFWPYHWMPFAYFGSLCATLVLMPASQPSFSLYRRMIPLVVFMFSLLILIRPAGDFLHQISGNQPAPLKAGRVDEIANYLRKHLQPTDKVQPLDWTGGALHGMLISEAVVATPYIYDYHFYHHVSEPYIQEIRKRFIEQLKEEKPRFIIDMAVKPRPKGEDTTTEFPELKKFIGESYIVVYVGDGFKILERNKYTLIAP